MVYASPRNAPGLLLVLLLMAGTPAARPGREPVNRSGGSLAGRPGGGRRAAASGAAAARAADGRHDRSRGGLRRPASHADRHARGLEARLRVRLRPPRAFDPQYQVLPDIAERVEVKDGGRSFTFHLRRGHRWSDGAPFTSADFAYWWKHVANNEDLSPGGPPTLLLVDGEPPVVEFPDTWTVRFRWSKPNNLFLLDQAGAYPTQLYRPAHYLKQFHKAFTDPAKLQSLIKAERQRNWAALHNKRVLPSADGKAGSFGLNGSQRPAKQPS
jgi:peptide/nickel transport system substrate-binding protein